MIISAPRLFTGAAFTGPGGVVVEDGVITAVLGAPPAAADVTLDHGFLSPGLIDLHNNGAFGVDCAAAAPEGWSAYVAGLAAHGVTGVLATVITAPIPALHAAAARLRAAMAAHPALLGLHLEGPFLSPSRRGAHRADWLRTPADALNALLDDEALRATLRLITLAPELPGTMTAITRLVAAGVKVSLGHTDATAAQMRAAADAGASLVTHVFNAQSPLLPRAPGAPGAALTDPRLHPCLIVDGIHVDPVVLALAFAACPRAVAVTDSICIAGQADGASSSFGGDGVWLRDGAGRRADGTLAGAAITLDEGLRRLIAAGVPPEVAFAAATRHPADAIGSADRGRLAIGARADLVWWSDDFHVQRVWSAGHATGLTAMPRGTEHARVELHDLDERPTATIVAAFLAQERAAQAALGLAAPALAALADGVAAKLAAGGRLFYAGAGTSGRLGLLDAVECGPTFGVPDGLIIPLLAGGDGAFLHAVEGAEDDEAAAITALRDHNLSAADALIGIAASGQTPFTLAAVTYARERGALTGAIVNNRGTALAAAAAIAVVIDSGAEIIAGSTRLSAGTAQKVALTILSSTVMIRLGKIHGPYMVDLRATNAKLRGRAVRITAVLAGVTEAEAQAVLARADYSVKPAIVMLRLDLALEAAKDRLRAAGGSLRAALKD